MSRGRRQIEHTADVAFELWAPTEAELWEEAGVAVVALMTEGADLSSDPGLAAHTVRDVRIDAVDAEDRLVQWMNEVIYWATVQGFLLTAAALRLEGESVVGQATGVADGRAFMRAEVKSATYHDLRVTAVDGEWRAQVVIDV